MTKYSEIWLIIGNKTEIRKYNCGGNNMNRSIRTTIIIRLTCFIIPVMAACGKF